MPIPDWQLPRGVDRGLWDYLHSREMVAGYDAQMAESPLARQDVAFCERHFATPGMLLDLGCGTGRLARQFACRGFSCTGFDLSQEMLDEARRLDLDDRVTWRRGNMVDASDWPTEQFDSIACLFSTFGMIRGDAERRQALHLIKEHLKPGGVFVLHAHHRGFAGLGWRRFLTAEHTRAQAYGGAPLTLRHFTRRELVKRLHDASLTVMEIEDVRLDGVRSVHGFLIAARHA